jgi:hypothetical protein
VGLLDFHGELGDGGLCAMPGDISTRFVHNNHSQNGGMIPLFPVPSISQAVQACDTLCYRLEITVLRRFVTGILTGVCALFLLPAMMGCSGSAKAPSFSGVARINDTIQHPRICVTYTVNKTWYTVTMAAMPTVPSGAGWQEVGWTLALPAGGGSQPQYRVVLFNDANVNGQLDPFENLAGVRVKRGVYLNLKETSSGVWSLISTEDGTIVYLDATACTGDQVYVNADPDGIK